MAALLSFIDMLGTLISSIVNLVINLLTNIVDIILLLGKALVSIPAYLTGFLPPVYATCIITCITIAVVYLIAGRST